MLVLPTLPVLSLTVNVTNSSILFTQTIKLPVGLRASESSAAGNSSDSRVRVTTIPAAHTRSSVLVAVALKNQLLVFQLKPSTSSSIGSSSPSTTTVFVPVLHSRIPSDLVAPLQLSGFAFSAGNSWASLHFADGNGLHYMTQVDFASAGATAGEASSAPSALPALGAVDMEHVWLAEQWRSTMSVVRDSDRLCTLHSIEWQGGVRYAGIAGGSAEAGQSVDIFTGGLLRVFANLIPGAEYSVGVNGTIVPFTDPLSTAASRSAIIGRANSRSELFLFPAR